MIKCDNKDLKQYIENLQNCSKYALVDTVRNTLSEAARMAHSIYKQNIEKELVLRGGKKSNIVAKSAHYEKAKYSEHNIDKMVSYVGQQAQTYGKPTEQLKIQELGETIHAKKKFILKPTKFTRGGSYKNLVKKENLISRTNAYHIQDIAQHPVKDNPTKQFKQAIAVAHTTHKTINFVPDGKSSGHKFGVFQFKDTGTRTLKGGGKKIKGKSAKLLYSFKASFQNIRPRPMLQSAVAEVAPKIGEFFVKEADKRLAQEMSKNLKK